MPTPSPIASTRSKRGYAANTSPRDRGARSTSAAHRPAGRRNARRRAASSRGRAGAHRRPRSRAGPRRTCARRGAPPSRREQQRQAREREREPRRAPDADRGQARTVAAKTTRVAETLCTIGGGEAPREDRQHLQDVHHPGRPPRRSARASTSTSGYSRTSRTRPARRAHSVRRRALRRGRAGSRTPSDARARVAPPPGAHVQARPRRRARQLASNVTGSGSVTAPSMSAKTSAVGSGRIRAAVAGVTSGRRAKLTTKVRDRRPTAAPTATGTTRRPSRCTS